MPKTRIVRSYQAGMRSEEIPILKENEKIVIATFVRASEKFNGYIEYVIEEQDEIETKEEMQESREQLDVRETFYALLESALILDEKVIYSFVTKKWQNLYGVTSADMGGIIDQLRITEGVEVAIFGYELQPCEFKISMRSNDYVDVSKIAAIFGGGGHIKAAGCTMNGTSRDIINNLLPYIEKQLKVESDC